MAAELDDYYRQQAMTAPRFLDQAEISRMGIYSERTMAFASSCLTPRFAASAIRQIASIPKNPDATDILASEPSGACLDVQRGLTRRSPLQRPPSLPRPKGLRRTFSISKLGPCSSPKEEKKILIVGVRTLVSASTLAPALRLNGWRNVESSVEIASTGRRRWRPRAGERRSAPLRTCLYTYRTGIAGHISCSDTDRQARSTQSRVWWVVLAVRTAIAVLCIN